MERERERDREVKINVTNMKNIKNFTVDDAKMFTSEVHDPYARTTGA